MQPQLAWNLLCSPGWPQAAELICLPLPPECSDVRCAPWPAQSLQLAPVDLPYPLSGIQEKSKDVSWP